VHDVADGRNAVAKRKPRFRRINANVIGSGIAGYKIVSQICAVALGVDGKKRGQLRQLLDNARPNEAVPEVGSDYYIRFRANGSNKVHKFPFEIMR
jgi:hypothetical protein